MKEMAALSTSCSRSDLAGSAKICGCTRESAGRSPALGKCPSLHKRGCAILGVALAIHLEVVRMRVPTSQRRHTDRSLLHG